MAASDWLKSIETDVLVIGGGLAGLRAALSARQAGAKVTIAVKRQVGRSGSSANTTGGYAAVMSELNQSDDPKLHKIDTIVGGGYVNDRKLVQLLVEEGPVRLRELLALGARFRKSQGQFYLSPSGDHSISRVLNPENMRGTDLTLPLREAALEAGVHFLEDCVVLDLLSDEGHVRGAIAVNRLAPEGYLLLARSVVLAMGGAGRMFPTTSNPVDVVGSGYALAHRAGACLRDMEFIQFYPWRLIEPFRSTRVPIQPSTFALGAKLLNSRGERFMKTYDPVRIESTTRDLSARGIGDQIRKGLAIDGGVVLDVTDVPDEQFRFENPRVVELLERKNLDYREIQLIVAPEAHYFMGGVDIDEHGASSVSGLFAAGENAGGVHGGNRLNSNAIPDTLVFGHRAGMAAASHAHDSRSALHKSSTAEDMAHALQGVTAGAASPDTLEAAVGLRDILGANLALVRDQNGLEKVLREADKTKQSLESMQRRTIGDVIAQAELRDLATTAILTAKSALCRTESRSAHFRSDFPETDLMWLQTVVVEANRVMVRAIHADADEPDLETYRKSHMKKSEPAGREHVE